MEILWEANSLYGNRHYRVRGNEEVVIYEHRSPRRDEYTPCASMSRKRFDEQYVPTDRPHLNNVFEGCFFIDWQRKLLEEWADKYAPDLYLIENHLCTEEDAMVWFDEAVIDALYGYPETRKMFLKTRPC